MSNTAAIDRAGPGQWAADLSLGIKLTLGARRSSWGRLVLTAVGVGLGVLVLLFGASAPHVVDVHQSQSHRLQIWGGEPKGVVDGAHPIRIQSGSTAFRGQDIDVTYLQPTGHNPAVPPGVTALPGPGHTIVSPALQRLLSGSDGALLTSRFPSVTGSISRAGLVGPADLRAYIGARDLPRSQVVYDFTGTPSGPTHLPPLLWVLLVVGVVVLLFPVFVFVVASARLSGATRDRRLAALRLVGGSSAQVRRIAAGEALLGSVLGLLVGAGLFLAGRPFIEHQELQGVSVFARDIIPSNTLIVLIVLAIPVITVGTALFALRDTIIEPLGVVRRTTPPKRRLLWRLVVPVLGTLLLMRSHSGSTVTLTLGVVLLLLSVPLLLPWLLQRVIVLIRRGKPSWELATARLEMDSATPSRVVSGVAVVLAGAIALFTLMLTAQHSIDGPTPAFDAQSGIVHSYVRPASVAQAEQMAAAVRKVPGVHQSGALFSLTADTGTDEYTSLTVGSCASLRVVVNLPSCTDGDVFTNGGRFGPGHVLRIEKPNGTGGTLPYALPARLKKISSVRQSEGDTGIPLYATTAAVRRIPVALGTTDIRATTGTNSDALMERIRESLGPYSWRVFFVDSNAPEEFSQDARSLDTIRRGLYIGAALTLALAAASMLVITLEQIRDRRRPLAGLAASGVPRWMLARSLLWQNAIPVLLAVIVSILAGLLLGALTLRIANASVSFDVVNIAALSGIALGVVAIATALTLPSVWQATRLTTLREE